MLRPNLIVKSKPDTLIVSKVNEVYLKIDSEQAIKQELSDYFSFPVPGAQWMPAYRNRMWDGKIRLYNALNGNLYQGLLPYVEKFAKDREYKLEIDKALHEEYISPHVSNVKRDVPCSVEPRDYQIESFKHCLNKNRALLLSPTASGKSLIIYLLTQCYNLNTLIIVPTTSLVHQMEKNLIEYGMHPDEIHIIMGGKEKITTKRVVISTWQSIYKLKKDWFRQFKVVIGDECHLFKAKSLTSIMTKLVDCPFRFGFTGTLDGTETHKLVLEGLFGQVKQIVKTKDLIDKKHLSSFKIKCIVLKYGEKYSKMKYHDEMDFLVRHEARNKFIVNLAKTIKGNSLFLFQYVEKHGKVLYDAIKKENPNTFFVHGGVDAKDREEIRNIVNNHDGAIIVASFGTFSTGIDIPNLHNIVFCSPTRSRIRNLQSIGRGLRRGTNKTKAILYDIADDLRYGKWINYTLKHFKERIKLYNQEEFDYKIYNVKI